MLPVTATWGGFPLIQDTPENMRLNIGVTESVCSGLVLHLGITHCSLLPFVCLFTLITCLYTDLPDVTRAYLLLCSLSFFTIFFICLSKKM